MSQIEVIFAAHFDTSTGAAIAGSMSDTVWLFFLAFIAAPL